MLENAIALVCLDSLRVSTQQIFGRYDEAVGRGDRKAARQAKREIVSAGKVALAPFKLEEMGGIYLFLDAIPASSQDLRYIGRSRPSRPLARRITDRFRDDSALDTSLYTRSLDQVRAIAFNRMRTAMRSGDETLRCYADKHCRTMQQFQSLKYIVALPIRAQQRVIDDVEHLLIYSASEAGCALTNVQERQRFRRSASSEIRRAFSALDDMRDILAPELIDSWSATLGRVLE